MDIFLVMYTTHVFFTDKDNVFVALRIHNFQSFFPKKTMKERKFFFNKRHNEIGPHSAVWTVTTCVQYKLQILSIHSLCDD